MSSSKKTLSPHTPPFVPSYQRTCYHGNYVMSFPWVQPQPLRSISPASLEKSLLWQEGTLEIMEITGSLNLGGEPIHSIYKHSPIPVGWERGILKKLMS